VEWEFLNWEKLGAYAETLVLGRKSGLRIITKMTWQLIKSFYCKNQNNRIVCKFKKMFYALTANAPVFPIKVHLLVFFVSS